MKNSSNTIGYIAALLTVVAAVFKIMHWTGANMTMIISGGFLSIYFFVFIANKLADANGGKSLTMHYALGLSAALINLGIIFKIEHWAGASILLVLGFAAFAIVFLPMSLMDKMNKENWAANKSVAITGFLGALLISLGLIFKIQHWTSASILLILGAAILMLVHFPLYMSSSKNAEEKYTYLRDVFFAIIIGSILTIFFMRHAISQEGNPTARVVSVAADKMNVLYVGVENPVTITVSDIPADKITASISNGTIEGSNGKFIAKPVESGEATITIMADSEKVGSQEFRVKRIADPQAYIGNYTGDASISKDELMKAEGVDVKISNFDFDLKFEVVSFYMSANIAGVITEVVSNSSQFTEGMKSMIQKLQPGAKVFVEQIKVKGPDGSIRNLTPILLKIK